MVKFFLRDCWGGVCLCASLAVLLHGLLDGRNFEINLGGVCWDE